MLPNPRKTLLIVVACVIILSIGAALYPFITNPTSVTAAYDSAGFLAPVIFLVLVMVAPTTGSIVGLSGGAYFGVWEGAFLLFVGNLIGVCITFLVVRRFGRPAAERFLNPEKLGKADHFVRGHPFVQWLVYAIPVFPLELMTAVIALSDRPFKRFFITVLAALPVYAFLVTYIGNSLGVEYRVFFEYASMAIVFVMAFAIVLFIYHWQHAAIHATGKALQAAAYEGAQNVGREVTRIHGVAKKARKHATRFTKKQARKIARPRRR